MARSSSSLPVFFFAGVLLIAFVLRVVQSVSPNHKTSSENTPKEQIVLNQTTCADAGGTWNACGSLCRATLPTPSGVGTPTIPLRDVGAEVPCAEVCVEQCECVSGDQCPFGYTCDAFVDGQGICEVRSSTSL